MVKAKPFYKLLPPNSLIWRDTLYIQYKDGTAVSISLLSKLAKVIDDYLNGRVSEIVIESDEVDIKMTIQQAKFIGNGLVAEYLFWEGTGTTLHDTSGNENNGTIYNASWTQLENGKYSLYFDPTNHAYVELPNNDVIKPDFFMLEVLFRYDISKDTGTYKCIYEEYDGTNGVGFNIDPANNLYFALRDVNGVGHTIWYGKIDDKWHIVHCGFDDSYVMFFFFDGSLLSRLDVGARRTKSSLSPRIASTGRQTPGLYFPGNIALVRLFRITHKVDTTIYTLYKLAKIAVPELR